MVIVYTTKPLRATQWPSHRKNRIMNKIIGSQWHTNPEGRKTLLSVTCPNGIGSQLDSKPEQREVDISSQWLNENVNKGITARKWYSSYYLKHIVEKAAGKYVTNGAFIKAALDMGLPFKYSGETPNVNFKIKLA